MVKLKKFIIFSCLLGLFLTASCSKTNKQLFEQNDRLKILSTIGQIENLVSEVGGDRIESLILVRGELNPHTYELVKGDDEKIQGATKIFYNGLGLEHSASVSSMIQTHPGKCALGEIIQEKLPEQILWRDGAPDPHIWMDISLWKEAVMPIAIELSQADPEGSSYYRERAERYIEKMEIVDQEVRKTLQVIPEDRRYLVTSHDAFSYFTRRYLSEKNEVDWGKRFAAPEGLSPEVQLNPNDLKKIIEHLKTYHIEVLFPESNVSRDSIRKLVNAGMKMGMQLRVCKGVLYGDSFQGSYLEAMKHNASLIAQSLSEPNSTARVYD